MADPGIDGDEVDGGTETVPIFQFSSSIADTLRNFGDNPEGYIRGVLYSELLRGIARLVFPIFGALSLIFLGTDPGKFASYNEVHGVGGGMMGIFDLVPYLFQVIADTGQDVIILYFDTVNGVIVAITPSLPGPIDGIITTVAIVGVTIVVIETLRRLLLAGMDAVPVIGPALKTLITGK